MINLLLSIVAHGTGVQEHGISLVYIVGGLIACHLHDRGNHLRIGHIHLTAIGLNIQFLHPFSEKSTATTACDGALLYS